MIVSIDPGKNIGIAFVSLSGELIKSEIITMEQMIEYDFPEGAEIVIGNGTSSSKIAKKLSHLKPKLVDETNTSLLAKELYFADHPVKGWMKLLPKGLRSPSVLIDDYAAYAIALRYLESFKQPDR